MKPQEQRLKECIAIRAQLRTYVDDDSGCRDLIDAMTHFVRDGSPATGSVYVPQLDRTLNYVLSTKKDSYAVIKAKPTGS
jgi:hypothetical protein